MVVELRYVINEFWKSICYCRYSSEVGVGHERGEAHMVGEHYNFPQHDTHTTITKGWSDFCKTESCVLANG